MVQSFEELKPMLRPTGIQNGIMKIDEDICTSCGQCIENCPFKCWEMGEDGFPKLKDEYTCFSCFNCMVTCPVDAVSIVQSFSVHEGYFDTQFPAVKMPLEPKNAEGNPDQWNLVERTVLERRTARNFKDEMVPDHLIRRVLEAGRFAPSAGNQQLWKFTVVTNKDFLKQLEETCWSIWDNAHKLYKADETVMELVKMLGEPVQPGIFDPRVQGGVGCVSRKELPVFLNAPVLIFLGANDKMAGPELNAGICGQNMNLVAKSLGLGFCWSGFGTAVNFVPELKSKLGFDDPWRVQAVLCIGYPKFKQEGMVPRQYRPVTWFRPGKLEPEIED